MHYKGETPAYTESPSEEPMTTAPVAAPSIENLKRMTMDALRTEWQRLYRSIPERRVSRDLLVLSAAWKYQERVSGSRAAPTIRRLKRLTQSIEADRSYAEIRKVTLRPGTRLLREWNGTTYTVCVVEEGFEWEGQCYRSFSQIARAITGTRWSGPRFFGLKQRPVPEETPERNNE